MTAVLNASFDTQPRLGPIGQSVRIGFLVLQAALLMLAAAWALGNVRQVPADTRAVVMRFGHVARVQEAGLVLAWPAPIEQIATLPSADRQIALKMTNAGDGSRSVETDFVIHQQDDAVSLRPMKDTMNAGYRLTGDGSVVQFDHAVLQHRQASGLCAQRKPCGTGARQAFSRQRGGDCGNTGPR
jgi:regulator of protease activity HflC (stomatin/prohibitin superfamily)